jgi:hypothetical protein
MGCRCSGRKPAISRLLTRCRTFSDDTRMGSTLARSAAAQGITAETARSAYQDHRGCLALLLGCGNGRIKLGPRRGEAGR